MGWRDDVTEGVRRINGQGSLSEIYASVAIVRSEAALDLPMAWQAIVRRELENNSSDSMSFMKRHDLFYSVEGIGKGLWGLRQATLTASDLEPPPPEVQAVEICRIIRDTKITKALKKLYQHRCQVCDERLEIAPGQFYSEGHHVKPLGTPHRGPDVASNVIIVCPTHHVLFDYGAIKLKPSQLRFLVGHQLGQAYIEYHNETIAG